MNCKPGDMAIIVRSMNGNEGRFVEVLGHVESGKFLPCSGGFDKSLFLWRVRSLGSPILSTSGFEETVFACPDAWLRPIRPNPPEEETTTNKELEAV